MNQSFPHIRMKIREERNKKGKSRNEELEGVKDGGVHNTGSEDEQVKMQESRHRDRIIVEKNMSFHQQNVLFICCLSCSFRRTSIL